MVQSNINDLAMERVQAAEYVDLLNFVAMDIAEQTEIYVNRYRTKPNPAPGSATPTWTVNIPYTISLPVTVGPPVLNDLSIFRFIRVVRGLNDWFECREYSQQSISASISANSSFNINRTQLGTYDFLTMIGSPLTGMDGSVSLIFGGHFEEEEEVVIDYISNRPFGNPTAAGISSTGGTALNQWNPNNNNPQSIPDFLRNAFEWGLLWRVCESLYFKGDESFVQKAERAKSMYQIYLRAAVGYAKMFKDNKSSLQMQPVNWLPAEYE